MGIMKKITEIVGVPKNNGASPEEEMENQRREEKKQILDAEAAERKEALLAEIAAQYKDWQGNLPAVEQQECELMKAQAYPLRSFLMKHVTPYVIEATSKLCSFKPDDPVDFMAEHLLQSIKEEEFIC